MRAVRTALFPPDAQAEFTQEKCLPKSYTKEHRHNRTGSIPERRLRM